MKRSLLLLAVLLVTSVASAEDQTQMLLARSWPEASYASLDELGTGIGVVFTPDLSVEGNCRFFQALGFACFESADWLDVLGRIQDYDAIHPGQRIRTLILETHGTNGHGLKLQMGKHPDDERSYIAVAALQERLDPVGVSTIVLSACNSGRLLRPEIYRRLNREPGDKLFLPATRGIIDATEAFDEEKSRITVVTPGASHIETTLVGSLRELTPATRTALELAALRHGVELPQQFAISEMMIRMLLRDPELELRTGAHVDELSGEQTTPEASERLFRAFVEHLDTVAKRHAPTLAADSDGR